MHTTSYLFKPFKK